MPSAIVGRAVLLDALGTLLAQGVYSVHLFANDFEPTIDSLPGSFTEPTYDSYPVGGIVPPLPSYGNLGSRGAMSQVSVSFPAPQAGPAVLVWGWFVLFLPSHLAGGQKVLACSRWGGAPITLTVGEPDLPLIIDFGDLDVAHP